MTGELPSERVLILNVATTPSSETCGKGWLGVPFLPQFEEGLWTQRHYREAIDNTRAVEPGGATSFAVESVGSYGGRKFRID